MGNSHSDDSQPAKGNHHSTPQSFAKSGEKEIIIKCSVEEMTKVFFKDYVIVWHDPNVNNKENQEYITQLKKFCEVFPLTEWEKASAFVKEAKAICHVITSGTNGELLVKEVFESENVCNIYVFCRNKEYHDSWAKNYPKVSCVETHIKRLFEQIQQNLLEWYKKASSLNYNLPAFAPIFDDSDKSEMNNLHLYLKVIPNFKNREQAKEDFLSLSKAIYTDAQNTKFIADFENSYNQYNKDHTLRWYTLESFLYKVTNNCLRIATSDSIQYCRLALKDIEQAIKDQYREKSKNFNGLLYRGAYLSQEEWLNLKENQDKEIEMHGFLSVSKEKNVALNFLRDPSKMVFITIVVPKGPNEEEQGFAEIEEYSQYPQEREILFNVRSRFTVLETEDDYEYSGGSKCRHLVLLYGAQGFRKFVNERNPVQEKLIANTDDLSCARCSVKNEGALFLSISDDHYYCKSCTDSEVGPFLYVDQMAKSQTVKIKGCLLKNSIPEETPLYGYKCSNCKAKKEKSYFICTDCSGKKWCENCFDGASECLKGGHQILLETSPFSFWCEKMSANELHHLKFQNNLVQKGGDAFQQAEMYFESHKYEKAIEYYSLYIEKNEANLKDPNLAASYSRLGKVYERHGDYKKALEYSLKSLDISKGISGDNHPLVAATYSNIGRICEQQGDYKKALEYQFRALDINKAVFGDVHPTVSHCLHALGSVYEKQRQYQKALEYYLGSLGIRKSVYGDIHPLVSTSYNNIGQVYYSQGDYGNALGHFSKSLEIGKLIYGDNHPEVATTYCNIGTVFLSQREFPKALGYLLKALEIERLIHGENHPQLATSYNNIGGVYDGQREYKKALEYYLKALDIYKSAYGDTHPLVTTSCYNIGNAYYNQEEYGSALEYLQKSLDIRRLIYGENHPETGSSYKIMADVYDDKGEYEKAIEFFLRFVDIYGSIYGENQEAIIISYNNIACAYDKQGDSKNALKSHLKCLDLKRSLFGDHHLAVAASYNNIGAFFSRQGEYETALGYFEKCLEIEEPAYGEHHPCVAISYHNIGDLYMNRGEYKKAVGYFEKSLVIFRSVYGEDDQRSMAIYNKILGILLMEQNGHSASS